MLRIFSSYRKIKALIDLANNLSDQRPANTPKFGFLLTNRSFLVPLIGLTLSLLITFNFPLLIPVVDFINQHGAEEIADNIAFIITALSIIYAQIEIAMSKGRAILTRKQAEKAVTEVAGNDELANSLKKAITGK